MVLSKMMQLCFVTTDVASFRTLGNPLYGRGFVANFAKSLLALEGRVCINVTGHGLLQ
jgi:hypothetical protein